MVDHFATGRQFYKCGRREGGCDFFLWADQAPPSSTSTAAGGHFGPTTGSSGAYLNSSSTTRQPGLLSARRTGGQGTTRGQGRTSRGGHTRGGYGGGAQSDNRGLFAMAGASASDQDNQTVMCNCGNEAVQRTVQKEGPNKGRMFFTCSKPREDQCGFFEWADNVPSCYVKQTRTRGGGGRGRGRGRGGARSTELGASGDVTTGTRKRAPPTCSVCRQQGHTKRSCPQARQMS